MVLIQVMIAQVQLNDTDQFGVELGLQDSVLFDRSLLSDVQQITNTTTTQSAGGTTVTTENQNVINANGAAGLQFQYPHRRSQLGNNLNSAQHVATAGRVGAQGLSNFAVNRVDPSLGFSGFVFSASSNAVSVLLRALQEKRRLEVLSRPQLMALDGQPGGGASRPGRADRVRASTSRNSAKRISIVYRSVGLILQVVPRHQSGWLGRDANHCEEVASLRRPGHSDLDCSTGGQVVSAPRIDISQALTTISAVSGQTVVSRRSDRNDEERHPSPRADHRRYSADRRLVPLR